MVVQPIPSPLRSALRAYRQLHLTIERPKRSRSKHPKTTIRLNETQLARLVAGYEGGATVYELAAEFGIGRNTVALQLKVPE